MPLAGMLARNHHEVYKEEERRRNGRERESVVFLQCANSLAINSMYFRNVHANIPLHR